jgi:hypothetical protein
MASAVERYCGRDCIGRLFKETSVEFFRQYVAHYHGHPELTGRFSPGTEAFIATHGTEHTKVDSTRQEAACLPVCSNIHRPGVGDIGSVTGAHRRHFLSAAPHNQGGVIRDVFSDGVADRTSCIH